MTMNNELDPIMAMLGDEGIDLSGQPQTPRDFIADTLRRMSVTAGTEDSEVTDPDAPVEDNIEILDKAMFALGNQFSAANIDDDERIRNREKQAAAERSLQEIMDGFTAATESLEMEDATAEVLQELKLRDELGYQMAKLSEVRKRILEDNGVSVQTYNTLNSIGLGLESHLPAKHTYTKDPSFNGMTATLESVDRVQVAAGAVAALLGIGIVYKIYKWIKAKLTKDPEERSANVDEALAKVNAVLDGNAELVQKLSRAMEGASPEDKFKVLSRYMDNDEEAKKLSRADADTIIKHMTSKAIDSVQGDLVDITTDEGLKQVKERKTALIEGMREIQINLKKINDELTKAFGRDDLPESVTNTKSKNIFAKVKAYTSTEARNERRTAKEIADGARKVQAILNDSDFRKVDKSVDTILTAAKLVHTRLSDNGKRLSEKQYKIFNTDIANIRDLARDIQLNHTYLVRVQVQAGKELVKIVKSNDKTEKFLKEFSKR